MGLCASLVKDGIGLTGMSGSESMGEYPEFSEEACSRDKRFTHDSQEDKQLDSTSGLDCTIRKPQRCLGRRAKMNERELFIAARSIECPKERMAFLRSACGEDEAVMQRILTLLENQSEQMERFQEPHASDSVHTNIGVGEFIGPYKILEQIGEGGFGVVFMAEQSDPVRRTVALKVIKPGMDTRQVIARFEAERQALAMMNHPNIARVFDAGTTKSGHPYFVMELVKGRPITQYCDERKLSIAERLQLLIDVCHAVQHAHNKGIIHRDLKPSNILIALYDDRPVVKVIDFGIAKATGESISKRTLQTGFGAIVGSLEYMSPEQASLNQLDIDTRSDIFALGVLLYELLTGSPPLNASKIREVGLIECLRMVREHLPTRPSLKLSSEESLANLAASRGSEPSKLPTLVRGDLDWIVMKSIEKDRNRRYETATSLADELHRYLSGKAVLAHPPKLTYLLRKWVFRNRQFVTIGLLIGLTGILLGFYATYQWSQEARRKAEHSRRVSEAIEKASQNLGSAIGSPIGRSDRWMVARSEANRVQELLLVSAVDPSTQLRAQNFLSDYRNAESDRRLAEQIEQVVMMSATQEDLQSWEKMEQDFRQLFLEQGIDLDNLSPQEIGRRIREHPSANKLSDALELLIGTLGQISGLGGKSATQESMQPLADAILEADSDPIRSGIRRLLYRGKKPSRDEVEAVVDGVDFRSLSPRTASWLATMYLMAGAMERCDEVFYQSLIEHPDDMMLNFDFAYSLAAMKRWPESIRYFLRCAAIRPDVAGVWRALGNAYRENGEYSRAKEALKKAIEIKSDHFPIYLDYAKVLKHTESFDAMVESLENAHRFGQPSKESLLLLGEARFGQAKYAQALVDFEKCRELVDSPNEEIEEWIQRCTMQLLIDKNVEE